MSDLRELHFDDLTAAVEETRSLLKSGYNARGNWTLGQVCRHLVLVQNPSVDGYPKWMSFFACLRPLMRRFLLPKLLGGDSPRGIRTASAFMPPNDVNDADEVEAFAASVQRFHQHRGDYAAHPAFGRMNRGQIEEIHSAHAAHHLRFLSPLK